MKLLLLAAAGLALAAAPVPPQVPAPAGPPASPAGPSVRPTPEALKRLDDVLTRAEGYVVVVEAAARNKETGTGCPPGFTVRDLAQDLRGRRLASTMGGNLPETGGAKRDWEIYHLCKALAANDAASCDQADAIASTSGRYTGAAPLAATYATNCRIAYAQTRAVASFIRRDPDFPRVCAASLPVLAQFKDAAGAQRICAAWRDDAGGGHEPLLAALQANLSQTMERTYLLGVVRELTADPAYCSKLEHGYMAAACRELNDYRRAYAASDAALCKGALCRAMMGGGVAACDAQSATFMRAACAQGYALDFASGNRDAFSRVADAAEKDLNALDAGASGPKELEAVGTRLDRLYALRSRMDKAASSYAPLSTTVAAPGAKNPPAKPAKK